MGGAREGIKDCQALIWIRGKRLRSTEGPFGVSQATKLLLPDGEHEPHLGSTGGLRPDAGSGPSQHAIRSETLDPISGEAEQHVGSKMAARAPA